MEGKKFRNNDMKSFLEDIMDHDIVKQSVCGQRIFGSWVVSWSWGFLGSFIRQLSGQT